MKNSGTKQILKNKKSNGSNKSGLKGYWVEFMGNYANK